MIVPPQVITNTITVEVPSDPIVETRIVEKIVEKFVDPEQDKIDDTDIEKDENGDFKIFEFISTPDDPDNRPDELSESFLQRTKTCQVKLLLAAIKKHLIVAEESTMKVAYIKKLYAEQLNRLVESSTLLETKETEL